MSIFDNGGYIGVKATYGKYSGPKIITAGLILHLDASNSASYPESGTTWFDLTESNYDVTLTNGPTFTSLKGGGIVFDGSNDYAVKTGISYTPYCVDIWFFNDDNITTAVMQGDYQILMAMGTYVGGFSLGAWSSVMTDETIAFWGSNHSSTGATYIRDTVNSGYHNLVANWNGSTYDIWVDGTKRTTYAADTLGHCTLHSRDNIYLATDPGGYSYEFDGTIHEVKIYNELKTDEEVLENFNALKDRFGI